MLSIAVRSIQFRATQRHVGWLSFLSTTNLLYRYVLCACNISGHCFHSVKIPSSGGSVSGVLRLIFLSSLTVWYLLLCYYV